MFNALCLYCFFVELGRPLSYVTWALSTSDPAEEWFGSLKFTATIENDSG